MAEYRAIREKFSLLEICYQPELAAEVTLQPVRALGVDAAILFADILLPAIPLGVGLEFAKGEGPVLQNPVRTLADVKNLRPVDPESDLGYVMDAIRILRGELTDTPLIGFCGAPFTVASYIIEGKSSREFLKTKLMMYSTPEVWHTLMEKLVIILSDYLVAQIRAGAQAVQVFNSWVGALSPQDYETFVLPYSQRILQAAKKENVPVIHFGTNTTTLLPLMKRAGSDVIGLDWRIPLDDGWKLLGEDVAVQGNLDPVTLFAPRHEIQKRVHDILRRACWKTRSHLQPRPRHPAAYASEQCEGCRGYSARVFGKQVDMEMNTLGLVAAITAFLSIWGGHVAVRKVEFISRTIWLPTIIFVGLGLTVDILSVLTTNRSLSAVLGILGITLLFDAFELTRQQKRIKKGHAPANPHNPRHAAILAEPRFHATRHDLLKREPIGVCTGKQP